MQYAVFIVLVVAAVWCEYVALERNSPWARWAFLVCMLTMALLVSWASLLATAFLAALGVGGFFTFPKVYAKAQQRREKRRRQEQE